MFRHRTPENHKRESREAFDRMARTYDKSLFSILWRPLYRRVIKNIDTVPHRSVLDIGCGTGALLSIIAKDVDVKLAGIDISPNMIRVANERLGQKADLKVGDAENLPWLDNTFDIVTSTNAFHHFPNPRIAVKEMMRVLQPDGLLVIGDVWLPSPFRQLANLLLPLSPQGDVRIYSEAKMSSLLKANGFYAISWETVDINSYVMTAKKPAK